MRFYHYTSAENYERIKVEGLTPYWIKKADLEPCGFLKVSMVSGSGEMTSPTKSMWAQFCGNS